MRGEHPDMGCGSSAPTGVKEALRDVPATPLRTREASLSISRVRGAFPYLDEVPEGSLDAEALAERMSAEHRALVAQFKTVLEAAGDKIPDDVTVLRSIRFSQGNVAKAVVLYQNFIEWYAAADTAGALKEEWPPEKLAVLEACYFQYFAPGHCKRGCPIKVRAACV